jgi:hypothetical protein
MPWSLDIQLVFIITITFAGTGPLLYLGESQDPISNRTGINMHTVRQTTRNTDPDPEFKTVFTLRSGHGT